VFDVIFNIATSSLEKLELLFDFTLPAKKYFDQIKADNSLAYLATHRKRFSEEELKKS
jgi:hypothetical protein